MACKKTSGQQLVRQWRQRESLRPPSGGQASITGGGSAGLQRRQDGSAKASLAAATPDIVHVQVDYSRQ